jgi:hypothetical protein
VSKHPIPDADVIASRELSVVDSGRKVLVQLGKPYPDSQDFLCPYRICYEDRVVGFDIPGVDAFQAIQLALHSLPTELRHNQKLPVGRIFQFEPGDDMGFPEVYK